MAVKMITGIAVEVDDEGFLKNPGDWNEAMAAELAEDDGIAPLTEGHWKVIRFMRQEYLERGQIPTLRRLKNTGGISIKELYELFPNGPAKKAARAAGLSKPDGCI